MGGLLSIGTKAKTINVIDIAIEFLNRPSTKEFIINLITQEQLFKKGEDGDGVKLSGKSGLDWVEGGEYSSNTIEGTSQYEGKRDKGQPTDRITLFSDGDLYGSFKIEINYPNIIIEADDQKGLDRLSDLLKTGVRFLGIQNENKEKIEAMVFRHVIDTVLKRLLS